MLKGSYTAIVGFSSKIQGWFDICKSIYDIYPISKMKDVNNLIISTDSKKSNWQNSSSTYAKNSQQQQKALNEVTWLLG